MKVEGIIGSPFATFSSFIQFIWKFWNFSSNLAKFDHFWKVKWPEVKLEEMGGGGD